MNTVTSTVISDLEVQEEEEEEEDNEDENGSDKSFKPEKKRADTPDSEISIVA